MDAVEPASLKGQVRVIMKCFLLLIALSGFCEPVSAQCDAGDLAEIIRLGAIAMLSDWRAASAFAFVERDAETSKGITTARTHHVFMIYGSDYYLPIAENDIPLSIQPLALERQKLALEVARRSRETQKERRRRAERYQKERNQAGTLLLEFVKAFDFKFVGEESINGHGTCVLDAKPRRDYRPPNREAKVLTGMRGRLWIENQHFHWVKAETEVLKPISMFGFVAKVLPGTRMDLTMAPVSDSQWLVSRFAVTLKSVVLWKVSERTSEYTYRNYRPAEEALAEELGIILEFPEMTEVFRP